MERAGTSKRVWVCKVQKMKVGDRIEVIDRRYAEYAMRGVILELDEHPLETSYAKIQVESPGLGSLRIWVNLRLAKVIEESRGEK